MASIDEKKNKDEEENIEIGIFILPNGLSKSYSNDLKKAALNNNFKIVDDDVEHVDELVVVTSLIEMDSIHKAMLKHVKKRKSINITVVNLRWLTDSNKNQTLCDRNDKKYFVGHLKLNESTEDTAKSAAQISSSSSSKSVKSLENFQLPDYECQRATPLEHFNEDLTKALEVLEENARFKGTETDAARELSFRRSICVLKCLPAKVKSIKQIKHLKHLGEHTLRVIEELLTKGYSEEVESIISSDYYKMAKQYNSIFGCGPAAINRLYEAGYRTLDDARETCLNDSDSILKFVHEFDRFKLGLTYYDDLVNKRVNLDECQRIFQSFKSIIHNRIDKECIVELMGGFRRGKPDGHDIDILITHPSKGEEKQILEKLVGILDGKGLVIYGKHQKESEHDWTSKHSSKNKFDHFERYLCILRIPTTSKKTSVETEEISVKRIKLDTNEAVDDDESFKLNKSDQMIESISNELDASKSSSGRKWLARRIDFIICPIDELPFALLGWTGSKHFVRSMRLYSDKELNCRLSSHGLFDFTKNELLKAETEEDIFKQLKLNYIKPSDRNC